MPEDEIRNPKSEIRNKSEATNAPNFRPSRFRIWDFVLRICFGFRASDFGFLGYALLARGDPFWEKTNDQ